MDFPGGPVVMTSLSNIRGAGLIPDQGAEIPHVSEPTEAIYCNKFSKNFKKFFQKNKKREKEQKRNGTTVKYISKMVDAHLTLSTIPLKVNGLCCIISFTWGN